MEDTTDDEENSNEKNSFFTPSVYLLAAFLFVMNIGSGFPTGGAIEVISHLLGAAFGALVVAGVLKYLFVKVAGMM